MRSLESTQMNKARWTKFKKRRNVKQSSREHRMKLIGKLLKRLRNARTERNKISLQVVILRLRRLLRLHKKELRIKINLAHNFLSPNQIGLKLEVSV
jgi:hypothetical protein